MSGAEARAIDMKLEIVVIPVLDVDRAKAFYAELGWRLDGDFASFNDPDSSRCLFQKLTQRLGRVEGNTTFGSSADLAAASGAQLPLPASMRNGMADRDGGSWSDWRAE